MPREKSKHRDRRSVSYSSESSYERKKVKSKHKRRSRSRDRSESSYRRKRSTSRSKNRRRSYSRSISKERYESKSKRRSTSRSKSKRSKHSRDNSRSRSSSRSRSKHSKNSKKYRKRSHSPNSKDSFDIDSRKSNLDDTETKIEKAIKAAEAVGLTMTKIPTYEYKDVEIKEDMPTIHDRNLLAEINSDSFMSKPFTSTRNKKPQNIVIDLNNETVRVPEADVKIHVDDSIINFDELPSHEDLKEMWIKKLYMYRKKMLRENADN